MSLKKATNVTFTDSDGFEKTYELLISEVNFDYTNKKVEIIYSGQLSDSKTAQGIPPRQFRQELNIDLTDNNILGLLVAVSDKLWTLNQSEAFIMDFSKVENGKVEPTLKNLTDLNAEIKVVR